MITFASARDRNHSRLRHSSRNLPLKLSVTPFCQGLPGSIKAVPMPCSTIHDNSAFDTNSGPLSLRRIGGAAGSLLTAASTAPAPASSRHRKDRAAASPTLDRQADRGRGGLVGHWGVGADQQRRRYCLVRQEFCEDDA